MHHNYHQIVKTSKISLDKRVAWFFLLNGCFSVLVFLLAAFGQYSFESQPVIYLSILFFLCSSPLLFADRYNGKFAIFLIFMPLFFLFYGASDLIRLLPGFYDNTKNYREPGYLSLAEFSILIGAALYIGGYLWTANINYKQSSHAVKAEWSIPIILMFGLFSWAAGLVGTWIWQFQYVDWNNKTNIQGNFTVIFVILRMLQPVGAALLIYAYLIKKSTPLLILVLCMLFIEFVFGFVADSKELSVRSIVILVIAYLLLYGSFPKKWIIAAVIVCIATFSVFQAYRYEVLQQRDTGRQEALQDFSANLDKALASKQLSEGRAISSIKGIVERTNLKGNMQLIVSRTGYDVAFQNGYTIGLLFHAVIPRFIWPDKPDSSVGRLFNREFKISEDPDTYISATHMGELYWNFGWPGLIVGMFFIGSFMGFLSAKLSLVDNPSALKFLVLISTIYLLCFRFEGGIALQYTLWLRSTIMLILLDMVFKRYRAVEPKNPRRFNIA